MAVGASRQCPRQRDGLDAGDAKGPIPADAGPVAHMQKCMQTASDPEIDRPLHDAARRGRHDFGWYYQVPLNSALWGSQLTVACF